MGCVSLKGFGHVLPDDGSGVGCGRRLPPSSRHHESGVWQGLYRLEVEVVLDSTRFNGKIGRCNGRKNEVL